MKLVGGFVILYGGHAPLLLPHLFKRIRKVKRADFFAVLEFQKFVAAVACHVNKYVRPIIREKALGSRHGRLNATYSCMRQKEKNGGRIIFITIGKN
jgi:hypothetical protein